ncbi:MAG TPA: glycosyltransferase [Bacteroidales bacterium]|nr:glycosyltransferase [Bacteroidales bacterium]
MHEFRIIFPTLQFYFLPVKNVLYISYDGMTDPLGQSQVIPYLQQLALCGYNITILSTEKPEKFAQNQQFIRQLLNSSGIGWEIVVYTKNPPVLSTVIDIFKLRRKVKKLMQTMRFDIVHCRSYISPMAGLMLKKKQGAKFLFDMRGFWADERVDGGLWNLKNPVYKTVYRYFKRKEKQYLEAADHIVSLTHNAKSEMQQWDFVKFDAGNISVIPCCADFDFFRIPDTTQRNNSRKKLGFTENELVLCYLGSLGTWYMVQEMFDFFSEVLHQYPNARFLIISGDWLNQEAQKAGIEPGKITLISAKRSEVVGLLAAADIGISFIKPSYSKKSSSPTKQGEMLAMGIPMIVNKGVGDVDSIVEETQTGIVIPDTTQEAYRMAAMQIPELLQKNKEDIRNRAAKILDLKVGAASYKNIYNTLTGDPN